MRLPARDSCFACEHTEKFTIWSSDTLDLIGCGKCRSEWLEGYYPGEEAYCYADYDSNPLLQRYHIARARRFAAYFKEVATGHDLLDIGCGTGEFCQEASRLGWDVAGIELTEEAASLARSKTGLNIISGDIIYDNLFPAESFDLITLWGLLEHVPHPQKLLKACLHLLRPKGVILLETPNALGLFRFVAQKLLKVSRGHFKKPFLETLGAGHIVWYSPRGLQETCRHLHLSIIDQRSSRNYTRILLARFKQFPIPIRWFFQAATALLNYSAAPIGLPNQMLAALRKEI